MAKSVELRADLASLDAVGRGLGPSIPAFLRSGALVASGAGVWAAWGDAELAADPDPDRLSIYAPDFLLRAERPWRLFPEHARLGPAALAAELAAASDAPRAMTWASAEFAPFAAAVADVKARIAAGELLKAVPFASRRAPEPLGPAARGRSLSRALGLVGRFPMFAYGAWSESEGMIGATPEVLFERSGEALRTMALAGTRAASEAGSLRDDPKEMLEHRLVVEGIVDRLRPLGRVRVEEAEELTLPTLVHLHSRILLEPNLPLDFAECVASLHPTPAIGAWPLEAGWEWLRAQPSAAARRRYGAPFGIAPPGGDELCLVAIRNVQWDRLGSAIHAGCGIVSASLVEREWAELNAKLDSVASALGL